MYAFEFALLVCELWVVSLYWRVVERGGSGSKEIGALHVGTLRLSELHGKFTPHPLGTKKTSY